MQDTSFATSAMATFSKEVAIKLLPPPEDFEPLMWHKGSLLLYPRMVPAGTLPSETTLSAEEQQQVTTWAHQFDSPVVTTLLPQEAPSEHDAILTTHIERILQTQRVAQVNIVLWKTTSTGISYLILRRSKVRGDFWQSPSGGVQPQESLTQAALRELGEELGITPSASRLQWANYSHSYCNGAAASHLMHDFLFFYELTKDDKITLSDEHVAKRWGSLDDVLPLFSWESSVVSHTLVDALIRQQLAA